MCLRGHFILLPLSLTKKGGNLSFPAIGLIFAFPFSPVSIYLSHDVFLICFFFVTWNSTRQICYRGSIVQGRGCQTEGIEVVPAILNVKPGSSLTCMALHSEQKASRIYQQRSLLKWAFTLGHASSIHVQYNTDLREFHVEKRPDIMHCTFGPILSRFLENGFN